MTRKTVHASVLGLLALASAATGQTLPGYELEWADEFNGTAVDQFRWERLNRRDSFNNEKQYYRPEQATVGNGNLRITATNVPLNGKAYRSGLVRTWAEQTYGRWEVRASLPTGQGMWPAIWLLPRNANWPSGGEIDIMENRGSQPTIIGSAYHFGADVASHQYIARDFSYSINGQPASFHGSMHTYAVEWDADRIRYFVNGIPHYTFYRNAAPISSTPMSLILNLAVGGDYGGDPNSSTVFPQHFDVDYVRVYSRDAVDPRLQNSSFESSSGGLFAEWDEYSNSTNVRIDPQPGNARTGSAAVQMFGRFNGSTSNNSGLFQEIPASPGDVFQLNAFARNRPGDVLLGTNTGQIKIEFIDANGQLLDVGRLQVASSSSPTSYQEFLLRRTAPANTKFARAVLEMVQRNNAGGAVNFDDVELRRVAGLMSADLNLDGFADSRDADALLDSLTFDNRLFDFNGDLVISGLDFDLWLDQSFGAVRGDANLDGSVDFDDLLVVAQNYGRTIDGAWATGDFTGEGRVDFDDLLRVAQTYQTSALNVQRTEAFQAEWLAAQSSVPEPTTLMLIPLLAAGLRRQNRMRP
jgi:beta-glucanase (GH16 family)